MSGRKSSAAGTGMNRPPAGSVLTGVAQRGKDPQPLLRSTRRPPRRETPETGPEDGGADRTRRIARTLLTVLAGMLVLLALAAPREAGQLTPLAFLRIPV